MYRAVVTQQAMESEAGEETRGDDLWTYFFLILYLWSGQNKTRRRGEGDVQFDKQYNSQFYFDYLHFSKNKVCM